MFSAYALAAYSSLSLEKVFLSLGIVWCAAFSILYYLYNDQRPPMPFIPAINLYYVIAYAMPIFAASKVQQEHFSIEDTSIYSLLLVFLGLAVMNSCFYISKRFLWSSISPIRLEGPYPVALLRKVLWVLLGAHFAFIFVGVLRNIPTLSTAFHQLGYVVFGMFYLLWVRKKLSLPQTLIILCVALPLELFTRLASGAVFEIAIFSFFIMVIIWYETKRIPKLFLIIMFGMVFLFNAVKFDYREMVWGRGYVGNPLTKAKIFIDVLVDSFSGVSEPVTVDRVTVALVSRVSYIQIFSRVIDDTPDIVPYWNGETYSSLFTKFIPRFIWPDKPQETIGNRFGKRYGFVRSDDYVTSFNLPWIIEMYVNFGTAGVLIGMLLLGAFLAFLEQKFNSLKMGPLAFVIGASLLCQLIYQESSFAVMTGNLLTMSIFLVLCFRFILKKSLDSQNVI